jgi:hypothetical protein
MVAVGEASKIVVSLLTNDMVAWDLTIKFKRIKQLNNNILFMF